MIGPALVVRRALPFALALGIWFAPVPAGLTAPAWHLFAIFVASIAAVLVGAFPLLTSTMLAVAAAVLTGTLSPAKAFAGFANASVLLVVIAFLVAQAVVKSGLGQRISLFMVSRFGRSSLGLAYSIVLTDAVIAPAFPSNTARGGVLFPIVLSVAQGSGSRPDDPEGRRLGGYLMFCAMASLAVSSALWMTATSANPIGLQIVREFGLEIGFGKWFVVASVPALTAILLLPRVVARLYPPGVTETPEAPLAARKALATLGPLTRDERVTAVAFALMVGGWIFADRLGLNVTSIAFAGLGVLLMTNVLTLDDIAAQGDTLATFLWLAVLFALSGQLNELGFMGYVGQRLASHLGGLAWPVTYVTLIVLYIAIHYMFVSQSSQVLALLGIFLDVGVRGGVPAPLMAFALLFASSYFSVITPQAGSQNVIFVGSAYLTQRELYRLGLLMTLFFLAVFLVVGTAWILLVTR
jgi:DASS family divalent anion:Na+ symporter